MSSLVLAFVLTIVVETFIASTILRRFCWVESTAIQMTTWPVAQLLAWRTGRFWPIEAGVVLVEAVLWRIVLPMSWRRAAVVSLITNGATAAIALVLS